MPSWFAAGFWNWLERNSYQADGCLLWPSGNPFIIGVSHSFLKISIDSLLWACGQNLREEMPWCFTSVQMQRWLLDGAWMNRPSCRGCCCSPFLSQAKWALALEGSIFAFLPLTAQPIVSLGNTSNYFTLYSEYLLKVFTPCSEVTQPGNKTWMSNLADPRFSYLLIILFFLINAHNIMNYSVVRMTFGWCSISSTLGLHAE